MFISNFGCPESRGNHSLNSKCRFKNHKIHDSACFTFLSCQLRSCFPYSWLIWTGNIEIKQKSIKNNSVTYMEYVLISNLGCPESRGNHSLTSKCRFKNHKIHDLPYVVELPVKLRSFFPYSWMI